MPKLRLTLEIAAIFILIECQIWVWPDYEWLAVLPAGLLIVSWVLHKDNWQALGIRPEPMSKDLKESMFWFFVIFFLGLVVNGMIWQPDWYEKWSCSKFWLDFLEKIPYYYPWALFQQLCVCSYFGSRLNSVLGNKKRASLVGAILFCIVHFPNPVLMTATFIGGYFSIYFFLQARNLYWIALGHAILGPAIRMFLDYTLRIGPGFWGR